MTMSQTLNENWSVSLKIVIPLMAGMLSTTIWVTSQIWRIENRQAIAWTLHDQREWARQVIILNPTVKVPDANEIFWTNRKAFLPIPQ